MATSKKLKYNFLLLGKTGSGKSSTGNTLLNVQIIKTSGAFKSCTQHAGLFSNDTGPFIISVVDTPGVFDTKMDMTTTLKHIYEAMGHIPDGFNALLLVCSLAEKCTQELNETIEALKSSFGDSSFIKYCVIIFTRVEDAPDMSNDTIKEWCQDKENIEEGSKLSNLLSQCQYRVVLFCNKDKTRREESVSKLLSYIDPQAPRYTNKLFVKCTKERDEYFISLGFPEQVAKIQEKIALLQSAIIKVQWEKSDKEIQKILFSISELENTIVEESKGTEKMNALKLKVNEFKKIAEGILELGEKEQTAAIKKLEKDVDQMKTGGLTSCVFAVISGSALGADIALTATKAISLVPGVGVGVFLGALTVGLISYSVYSYNKSSTESREKEKKQQ